MSEEKLEKLIGKVGSLGGEINDLTSENTRTQVLMAELRSQNEVILEYVKDIPDMKNRLTKIETDVAETKLDIKVIKGVIREHSADIIELKATAHSH